MNIWIFNHYAITPDLPGGTRHFDFARKLVKRGHRITIFAASLNYLLLKDSKHYKAGNYLIENVEDVDFVWVKTFTYRKNNWKRLINIFSYNIRVSRVINKGILTKPDVIIGSTVHPFAGLLARKFAGKYNVPFIFEIRDLWPQTMIDMGTWKANGILSRLFFMIEKLTVSAADAIIALSPLIKDYLLKRYRYENVHYIPNGIDLISFNERFNSFKDAAIDNDTVNTVRRLKTTNKFVIMYTGAIVLSNNIPMIINAAKQLRLKDADIHIVMVGKGQEAKRYKKMIQDLSLDNISILDPVQKKYVPVLLNLTDMLLLIQGKVYWGSMNKLFDYLASEKPILSAVTVKHNDLIEELSCGFSVSANDEKDLLDKIIKLYDLPEKEKISMGQKGRAYVEKHHSIPVLVDKLEALLEEFK